MTQIVVKVPRPLKTLMEKYIECDAHKDISEFVRTLLERKFNAMPQRSTKVCS